MAVIPALVAGIYAGTLLQRRGTGVNPCTLRVFVRFVGVDDRDKPGHDVLDVNPDSELRF
jgi:hypothetical protein